MTNNNYPTLYRCADATSIKAQNTYLLLNKVYLGLLVLGSLISAFATILSPTINNYLYIGLAAVLVVGLFIFWVMRARKDEKIWFDSRAVAESVKTATWRFMMGIPPFHEESTAEAIFIDNLKEIREARPHLGKHLAAEMNADGSAITEFMKRMQTSSLEERRDFYLKARIRDQKTWYTKKARSNADYGNRWFWIILFLQVLIMIIAIFQAIYGGCRINPIPIITTCAAALAAWSQIKRHDELAQSYALAAQELDEIEAIANNQASEDTFAHIVDQAEISISREHTMWCARRDVSLSKQSGANPRMGSQTHG